MNFSKKRLLMLVSLILSLVICFGLTACSNNPDDTDSSDSATETDHAHEYGNHSVSNSFHWYDCTICNEPTAKEPHSYVDGFCSICGHKEINLSPVDAQGNPSETGEYIKFGSYPQTLLSDEETIAGLNILLNEYTEGMPAPTNWTVCDTDASNTTDIMWYTDIESNDQLYRAIYFSQPKNHQMPYGSYSAPLPYQEANGYNVGTVYWFKFEPLLWKKIASASGSITLMCNMVIDTQDFCDGLSVNTSNTTIYPNNYEYSTMRKWLNETFMNTAFDQFEAEIIAKTNVDNSAATTPHEANKYACANTQDCIYLLSSADMGNEALKLNTNELRLKKPTDYAKCMGAEVSTAGNTSYWLRSPMDVEDSSSTVYIVDYNGSTSNQSIAYAFSGVCPIITVGT